LPWSRLKEYECEEVNLNSWVTYKLLLSSCYRWGCCDRNISLKIKAWIISYVLVGICSEIQDNNELEIRKNEDVTIPLTLRSAHPWY